MSTKIYNGYVIDSTNVLEIQKRMVEFGKQVRELTKSLYVSIVTRKAIEIFDHCYLGKAIDVDYKKWVYGKTLSPRQVASNYVWYKHEEIYRTMTRYPAYDFGCTVSLIFNSKKTYALLYTEREEFRKLFESIKGVKSYFYWDNVDHPNNMTNRAWQARGREWDKVLADGIPSHAGFSFECPDQYAPCIVRYADMDANLIPLDERAKEFAFDDAFKYYVKENKIEAKEIMHSFGDFRNWTETPKGKACLKKFKIAVKKKLVKRLTGKRLDKEINYTFPEEKK